MAKSNKQRRIEFISHLNKILNENTRPPHIVEIGEKSMFAQPNGKTSYVYLYTEVNTGMKYEGVRSIDTDDKVIEDYNTSSKNEDFQKALANGRWKFEILYWGSFKECLYYENQDLVKVDAANNPMWYNLWNGQRGMKPHDREFRNKIVKDLNVLRNIPFDDVLDWKSNPEKYNKRLNIATVDWIGNQISWQDLYENRGRIQVRDEQLNTQNVNDIKDYIIHNQPGLQWPIYCMDIKWKGEEENDMLLSGNHTVYTHYDLGSPYKFRMAYPIEIPKEVHEKCTETDLYEIGSALNARLSIGKPFTKEDALRMCKEHYEAGNTWYDSDVDNDWRLRGLTTPNINTVINEMNDYIEEKQQNAGGKVKINYSTPEGKQIIQENIRKYQKPGVLVVPMAGTSPNSDKLNQLMADENIKLSESSSSEPLYTEMVLLLHHSSDRTQTQSSTYIDRMRYIDELEEGIVKDHMKNLVQTLKVTTHDLPRFMPDSVYKKYKSKN